MSGCIWVESEPGKGAVFIFTIKLSHNNGAESQEAAEESSGENRTPDDKPQSFKGYRLLLAEDVEINREILLSLLEPLEIEIDCAVNGIEAVNMFKESPDKYDMIFMDMQMPQMDGLEATREIRRHESIMENNDSDTHIPIVAMTANVFKEDVNKCLEAGMNDHVGKPLDLNEVIKTMRRYLAGK